MEVLQTILLILVLVLQVLLILKSLSGTGKEKEIRDKEREERLLHEIEELSRDDYERFSLLKDTIHEGEKNLVEKSNDQSRDILTLINTHQLMMEKNSAALSGTLHEGVEKLSRTLEERMGQIQKDMSAKLDQGLNKRLDESFEKVTSQLSLLYKTLGELGEMSDGITSLNRTLANVKTRGTWGEMQLGSILSETLAENQYEKNVKVKTGSDDLVEFAIKIPGREQGEKAVFLPIDSKFPLDIYDRLIKASEAADKEQVEACRKELERRIKEEAKSIRDKYIAPPATTDFAILFLPTESLYAEVLRIEGLAEFCQNKYRVSLSSPQTITAMLNALKVGFLNIALNKKTAEIRKILEAVKSQYDRLDELIDATKKKLEAAQASNEELKKRTGIIQKNLKNITSMDEQEADRLLTGEE